MPHHPERPIITGTRGVLTSGHYLASAAGLRILQQGGNAIDAAAAMSFCLNLLEPHQNGFGGEVPILVYSARDKRVFAISGQGWSPKAFTIDWCRENGIDLIPGDGYLPACVPATFGAWAEALSRFGTMTFTEILQPAIELASDGFPMYPALHDTLSRFRSMLVEKYPTTADVFLPNGDVPEVGTVFRNEDVANTLRTLCTTEESVKHKGRIAGIEAARDAFYKGEISERIVDFIANNPIEDASGKSHAGLLAYEDFAEWEARVEDPITLNYRGLDVYKCSSWTQGPVFLQQLALLEGFDLAAMGHASLEYLHTLIECAKLAFADREAYYGDPLFDDVPLDVLLSREYAAERKVLLGPEASMELRPGDMGSGVPEYATFDVLEDNRRALRLAGAIDSGARKTRPVKPSDTTQLAAVDREGNMVSAIPSGGWIQTSPVIKGLGFPLGTRGQMFYLNAARPNALQPRKRPRTTLTPTVVTKNGEPYMAFGTPGGDSQDQWTLQFFLNFVEFGMDIQDALDSPHFGVMHVPESFYDREARPGEVWLDNRFASETIDGLRERGHIVKPVEYHVRMMAIVRDPDRRTMQGGVCYQSETGYALGW